MPAINSLSEPQIDALIKQIFSLPTKVHEFILHLYLENCKEEEINAIEIIINKSKEFEKLL